MLPLRMSLLARPCMWTSLSGALSLRTRRSCAAGPAGTGLLPATPLRASVGGMLRPGPPSSPLPSRQGAGLPTRLPPLCAFVALCSRKPTEVRTVSLRCRLSAAFGRSSARCFSGAMLSSSSARLDDRLPLPCGLGSALACCSLAAWGVRAAFPLGPSPSFSSLPPPLAPWAFGFLLLPWLAFGWGASPPGFGGWVLRLGRLVGLSVLASLGPPLCSLSLFLPAPRFCLALGARLPACRWRLAPRRLG